MSDSVVDLQVKIASFRNLKWGWNGYEANPPSEAAIQTSIRLVGSLAASDIDPTRIAPSAIGGIGITIRRGDRKAYVEITNAPKVHAIFSDGVSEPNVTTNYDSHARLIADVRDYLALHSPMTPGC